MPFRFRYQRILDVRRQQEKAKAQEVARRQAAVFRQKKVLGELERQWQEARETWLQSAGKGGSAVDLQEQVNRLEALRAEIDQGRHELGELIARLNAARNELVELMKQRKVFEKLEERDRAAYEARQNRMDQMMLDEIATTRQWRAQLEDSRRKNELG